MTKPTSKASPKATKSTGRVSRSKTKAVSKKPRTAATASTKVAAKEIAPDQPERRTLSKKELIARVAAHGDMKPGPARHALEATLAALRETLSEGSNVTAAPLGKIMIAREKETPNGKLVVCRVKLKPGATPAASNTTTEAAE